MPKGGIVRSQREHDKRQALNTTIKDALLRRFTMIAGSFHSMTKTLFLSFSFTFMMSGRAA